jgi:hypothetical protein
MCGGLQDKAQTRTLGVEFWKEQKGRFEAARERLHIKRVM